MYTALVEKDLHRRGLEANPVPRATLHEALAAFVGGRSGSIQDASGTEVLRVHFGRAVAPDGPWGPWQIPNDADLVKRLGASFLSWQKENPGCTPR